MKYDPAAVHAEQRKRAREDEVRREALTLAVRTTSAVLRSGRPVLKGETLRIAEVYAAYLRDGTVPAPGS